MQLPPVYQNTEREESALWRDEGASATRALDCRDSTVCRQLLCGETEKSLTMPSQMPVKNP